jgi:hypothetical protein
MNRFQLFSILLAPLVLLSLGLLLFKPPTSQRLPQTPLNLSQLTGEYDPLDTHGWFHTQTFPAPQHLAFLPQPQPQVLGQTSSPKRIEIDLTNQRIYAYEGDRQVYNYLVSTGKWGRTPTGHFNIWVKLRYTKMEGGSQALNTYYYLPNVPYTMYFSVVMASTALIGTPTSAIPCPTAASTCKLIKPVFYFTGPIPI